MEKSEINLMPVELQAKRLRREYVKSLRRLLAFFILLLLVALAVQLGTFFLVQRTNTDVTETARLSDQSGFDVVAKVQEVNTFLNSFDTRLATFRQWTVLLDEVFALTPDEILFNEVQFNEQKSILTVKGVTTERSAVLTLQKDLEELEWVARVEAPLTNFSIGESLNFTFDVVIDSGQEEEV